MSKRKKSPIGSRSPGSKKRKIKLYPEKTKVFALFKGISDFDCQVVFQGIVLDNSKNGIKVMYSDREVYIFKTEEQLTASIKEAITFCIKEAKPFIDTSDSSGPEISEVANQQLRDNLVEMSTKVKELQAVINGAQLLAGMTVAK